MDCYIYYELDHPSHKCTKPKKNKFKGNKNEGSGDGRYMMMMTLAILIVMKNMLYLHVMNLPICLKNILKSLEKQNLNVTS
jgi:hypothetical protein